MKFWQVMSTYHDLQAPLNRNKDIAGRHSKICITKSLESILLVINVVFLPFLGYKEEIE